LLHNHPHLSSGAGTIGQKWPQYKGLSPTPLAIEKIQVLVTVCIPPDLYSLVDARVTALNGWVGRCVDSWLADGRWIVGSVGELTGGSMGLWVSELIGGLENGDVCQISFMTTQ
jgi:hypothetical protein